MNRPEPPAGPTTLLDAGLADPHHLLVLGPDVTADEVEALAVSRSDTAGWAGHADIRLLPGVHLTGPWGIDPTLRVTFDLPNWADHAYLVQCPVLRTHPLPPALAGVDPILDAFPDGVPTGVEQEALDHLRAIARRLGGALRIAGSGAVVTLDPESATDLTVHAPIWLDPDACVSVLRPALPDPRNLLDEIPPDTAGDEPIEVYGVASGVGDDVVDVTVAGTAHLPLAVRLEPWARRGVIAYEVRWRPARPDLAFLARPPLGQRRARAGAALAIERAAAALHGAVGGTIVDDDGFLVDPAHLRR
ncbi:hypothetical protein [Georgenia deserti]|uniref:Uncharacterized protein n=1 Tax=Georgenia deserti TaxID=2093781 RepID=A0ABW4L7G9_9MICO